MLMKFRLKMARILLGTYGHLDHETHETWDAIWPKHDFYNDANKVIIRNALERAWSDGYTEGLRRSGS